MGIVDFMVVITDVDADADNDDATGVGTAVKAVRLAGIAAGEVFELTATVLYIAWFVQDMLPSLD